MPRYAKVYATQGSGSGHEQAHIMAVGKGMLDAACPGDIFAVPPIYRLPSFFLFRLVGEVELQAGWRLINCFVKC
jgi:dihydroxyacetone kinase